MKKTYAARGLIDFQMALKVGEAVLRIRFSDGAMGSNGVIPAKYVTENEALQAIIEKSEYFRKGRIFLYSSESPGFKGRRK